MLRHIFLLSIRAMARAFFCSKVTGAPPFHDVNVTQLIVIDYYYHHHEKVEKMSKWYYPYNKSPLLTDLDDYLDKNKIKSFDSFYQELEKYNVNIDKYYNYLM